MSDHQAFSVDERELANEHAVGLCGCEFPFEDCGRVDDLRGDDRKKQSSARSHLLDRVSELRGIGAGTNGDAIDVRSRRSRD